MKKLNPYYMTSIAVIALLCCSSASAADNYADDRAKIENLQARYMFALDWRDADTYAACFTEDGVLDWARGVQKGRNEIRAMMNNTRDEEAKRAAEASATIRPASMRHSITNIVIKIDGDRAVGRAYWMEYNNSKDRSVPVLGGYGHYEDELVKINGEWYFTKRKIYNEIRESRAAPAKSPAW